MKNMQLPRSFFTRDPEIVAKDLIWKIIVKWDCLWIISETEAYKWESDPASHASNGKTKRNAPMYEIGGVSYVYFIYWMYFCFNITTGKINDASAVLIRAVIPVSWIDEMITNRKYTKKDLKNLSNWPGKFCMAFGINMLHNHIDLLQEDSPIKIFENDRDIHLNIISTPRIGISVWKDKHWRYVLQDYK